MTTMMETGMSLDELREEIDRLDEEIAGKLVERAQVAKKVGQEKRRLNVTVHDPLRESRVLERVSRHCESSDMTAEEMKRIYKNIIAVCFDIQARDQQD